jgi:long-chain acyl-CoA synthetase
MNLAHLLARQARLAAERPALYEGTRPWASHAQWAGRCAALAQRLRAAGLAPGDRVLVFMRNHPRYLEILWAAWWAGLVVVPVNAKLHPAEVEWIVGDAQARWGFVTRDVAPQPLQGLERQVDVESGEAGALLAPAAAWEAVPIEERAPDDLAWLFYTSGTTGRPKGVMLTHRNLTTMGLTYFVDVDAVTPDDAIVYAAPMSHGCGLYAIPHLMAGARHVVPVSGAHWVSCRPSHPRRSSSAWSITPSRPHLAPTMPRARSRRSSTAARRCT